MSTSDFLNIIFFAISLFLGIYTYRKTHEEKEPKCYYKTYMDIAKFNDNNQRLKVFFDNKEVDQVSTTYLFFWNKGRKPIKQEDIPSPLKLTIAYPLTAFQILDFKVIKVSRPDVNFSVTRCDDQTLELGFNFLDKDDGVVIGIKHTADRYITPIILGTILGVPKGVESHLLPHDPLYRDNYFELLRKRMTFRFFLKTWDTFSYSLITYAVGIFAGLYSASSPAYQEALKPIIKSLPENFQFQPLYILPIAFLTIICILGFNYIDHKRKQKPPYPRSIDLLSQ